MRPGTSRAPLFPHFLDLLRGSSMSNGRTRPCRIGDGHTGEVHGRLGGEGTETVEEWGGVLSRGTSRVPLLLN